MRLLYSLFFIFIAVQAYAVPPIADYNQFKQVVDEYIYNIDERFTITGAQGVDIFDFAEKYLKPNAKTVRSYSLEAATSNNITTVNAELKYHDDFKVLSALKKPRLKSKLNSKDMLVLNTAEKIIDKIIKKGMSDYEKVLAIHDYIVLSTRYDEYAAANMNKANPDVYTAYGSLVANKAVCEGFARAMSLLLNMINVETIVVSGTSERGPHAWNKVRIASDWYNVDATFDAPVPYKKGEIRYDYLNVRDSDLAAHSWDKTLYPAASATKYNYFVYNKLVVDNFEDFKRIIESGLQKSGKASVYVIGYSASKYPLNFIYGSFSYSAPKRQNGVFTIQKR